MDLAALVATVAIVAVAASVAFGDFVALMAVVAFVAFEVAEAAEGAPVTEYLRCNGWARNTPHLVLAPMPEVQYFPLAFAWSQLQVFDTPWLSTFLWNQWASELRLVEQAWLALGLRMV